MGAACAKKHTEPSIQRYMAFTWAMGVKQGPCISLVRLQRMRQAPDKRRACTVLVIALSFAAVPSASTAFFKNTGAIRPAWHVLAVH